MRRATVTRLLSEYRSAGRTFSADGISSFVLDEGPPDAPAVVCVHGVPASAYLYRKVIPELAARGLRVPPWPPMPSSTWSSSM